MKDLGYLKISINSSDIKVVFSKIYSEVSWSYVRIPSTDTKCSPFILTLTRYISQIESSLTFFVVASNREKGKEQCL